MVHQCPRGRRARGLPPKVVQERLGHAKITMTFDCYGHSSPRIEDTKDLDAAEKRLLA